MSKHCFETLLLTTEFLHEVDPITFLKQIDVSTEPSVSCCGSRKVIYTCARRSGIMHTKVHSLIFQQLPLEESLS